MAEIFQKALNMSIAAGWLILAVIALRLLLRRAPKRFRLLLWAVVGLRLALPWSIESALSLIPSAQTLPEGIMLERTPVLDTGISALNGAINPGFTAAFTPELGVSANPLQVLLPIAAALWMLGAAAMLLWALVSWLRLRKRVREAVRLEENVYECEIASPFVLGLFRPRIYLPFSLENGERELVLAHERAHITAGDHIIKPLGWLLLAAHWYNPLVWLAYALFCRDIELACDERVVHGLSLSDRADYSQALLDLSRPRGGVRACPLAFGESSVKGRVKSVLSYKKPAFWLVLLAVVVCVGAAVCFLTDPKEEAEPVDDGDGGVVISARLEENFPAQVLDYAFACTEEMAEELSYLGLKSAELTDLSCYAEVEAPEGGTLLLFRLGARFELAEPESVAPAGGMVIEDGWLTRPDSGGDRFMLLLRDGDDWRFIGLVTEQVLSEYGTDYDAAALGEYALAASSAPVISLAEGLEGLPEGLLDCACFCVQLQAGFSAYELTSVEITQLELAAEFDGPDGGTLCLYKLGSRGKLADADAMPAGGVQIADGWFNDGLLYMLLRRDGEDLSYIGVMHELTLDEMGGDYEAAALDLYGRVLAGGVTWSSNLAMSSLNAIQCRFEFNYNALDMRFSASCSEGQLESSGHTLIWTPEPDTAFAVVSFTLRDASGESVSGSIVITRIARSSEASSTYLASLACPGYVMEPLASGTGATIRAAE
uniref:M56 family metallopeptidase n=1 Tax=Candidatus Scatomorpha intestinigallinarum TaxID=2840923 RepID=UPI004025B8C0